MLATGLSAPTQSGVGIAAATVSPMISYEIGQKFKELAKDNPDGKLTEKQQAAHVLAHAVLGAAVAAAGGNDVLAGALSAGGAEAVAPKVSTFLYGTADPEKLTAEQKDTVANIMSLAGAGVGAAVGNTSANAVSGSLNAESAVENNENAVRKYNNRRLLLENIADFEDPFGILAPFNAMRAESDYLNKLRNEKIRNEQDKMNENIRNYLWKHGINVDLKYETVLVNVNGIGKTITRLNTNENSKTLSKALQEFAQSTITNHATFRKAKEQLGIPKTMHPTAVRRVPLMESQSGISISKPDFFRNNIYATEYLFIFNGKNYVIQNHSAGHNFGLLDGLGNQAGHFNIKTYEFNGKVDTNIWKGEKDKPHNNQTYELNKIPNIPEHLYTKPSPYANPREPFFKNPTNSKKKGK